VAREEFLKDKRAHEPKRLSTTDLDNEHLLVSSATIDMLQSSFLLPFL